MTYQTKYNTKACQNLLQVFIKLVDTYQITYEEFNELTGESNFAFTKAMTQFKQMIKSLKMKMNLSKGKSISEEVHINSDIYVLNYLDEPYHIETNDVDPEELISYSLVIVYCMLKNGKYVSAKILSKTLPNINKDNFSDMIKKLKGIISEEIDKDNLQSYMLIEE